MRELTIRISEQADTLLAQLAVRGLYGNSPAQVVERFVDQALQGFVARPVLQVREPTRGPKPDPAPRKLYDLDGTIGRLEGQIDVLKEAKATPEVQASRVVVRADAPKPPQPEPPPPPVAPKPEAGQPPADRAYQNAKPPVGPVAKPQPRRWTQGQIEGEICRILKDRPHITPSGLAKEIGISSAYASMAIGHMYRGGRIIRSAKGLYRLPPASRPDPQPVVAPAKAPEAPVVPDPPKVEPARSPPPLPKPLAPPAKPVSAKPKIQTTQLPQYIRDQIEEHGGIGIDDLVERTGRPESTIMPFVKALVHRGQITNRNGWLVEREG